MIKILFFIENLSSGGAEKVLRTLVNNMDQSRFDITVITVWPEDPEQYLVKGIHYQSLYRKRNSFNRLRYRAEAALNLAYPLHIHGNYDIEAAYLECGATKIMAASTKRKAAKLAWVHCDLCKMTENPELFARKTARWYEKFQKVVCVAESVKDSFVKLFGDRIDSAVIYNTVDSDEILQKSVQSLPDTVCKRKPTIITVGRMYAQKGYDRLLKAVKGLSDEDYNFDLWILGDGPDRNSLEAYIHENQLQDRVFLLGFQSNPYPFMKAADLVVCSSRYEGFSTVVTESLILGKPVITTDCSGMRELLGNNEYGLITENSTDGIYQGLKKMLDDPDLLAQYEIRARERGKDFSKDRLVRETEDFLIRTLEEFRAS